MILADDRRRKMMRLNNGGGNLRQQLLDGAPFLSELLHTAVPQRAASGTTATFTRATASTWQNNDGYLVTGVAGEIGFPGARRVRNLLSATSAMSALPWAQAVTGASTVIATAGQSDPWGGTLATKLVFSASGAGEVIAWRQAISVTQANQHTSSIRIRADAPVTMYLRRGASAAFGSISVTTEWQDVEVLVAVAAGTTLNFDLSTKADAFTGTAAATTVYVIGGQVEDVTAQTTQTAGEYVSVGVESAPYYHGSMVDGVKCFPTDINGVPLTTMERYKPELAATNVLFKSNTLNDAAWANSGTVTVTQNVTGVDGATSAWTINDTDAAIASYRQQSKTLTAADWTQSCKVKKTTGAQTSYPVWFAYSPVASKIALCTIDTTNGVATVWSAFTGLTIATSSARCTSFNADYWLVELTFLATANLYEVCGFSPVGADTATKSTGVLVASQQGSKVAQQFQCELGSKATSYIDNTSAVAAVTRNADNLTYSGGDIPNLKTLMATFRREVGVSSVGVIAELHDGTANEDTYMYLATATNLAALGRDGGSTVLQTLSLTVPTNTYVPGTEGKYAVSTGASAADKRASDQGATAVMNIASAGVGTATTLGVGCYNTGGFQLNGTVGGIYGWTRNLSQSELNAVTS